MWTPASLPNHLQLLPAPLASQSHLWSVKPHIEICFNLSIRAPGRCRLTKIGKPISISLSVISITSMNQNWRPKRHTLKLFVWQRFKLSWCMRGMDYTSALLRTGIQVLLNQDPIPKFGIGPDQLSRNGSQVPCCCLIFHTIPEFQHEWETTKRLLSSAAVASRSQLFKLSPSWPSGEKSTQESWLWWHGWRCETQ